MAALPNHLVDLILSRLPSQSQVAMSSSSRRSIAVFGRTFSQSRTRLSAGIDASVHSPTSQYYPDITTVVPYAKSSRDKHGASKSIMRLHDTQSPNGLQELEVKVKALEEAAKIESAALDPPVYSEEQLMEIYEDVLALPLEDNEGALEQEFPRITDRPVGDSEVSFESLETRLVSFIESLDSKGVDRDEQWLANTRIAESFKTSPVALRRALYQIRELLTRLQSVSSRSQQNDEGPVNVEGNAGVEDSVPNVSLSSSAETIRPSYVTIAEFEGLLESSILAHDGQAAETTLRLAEFANTKLHEDAIGDVLEMYAIQGDVANSDRFISEFLKELPADRHRHLHIKSRLHAARRGSIPEDALALLHSYEDQSLPAPMKTYSSLLSALLSAEDSPSKARAQAWDLFAHMRYVAHPDPDVKLYTTMIRACALPVSPSRRSEPERALDLWTEMTVDKKLEPIAGSYDAVILACARSGKKFYIDHAFQMAQEMLNAHRDARGHSRYAPTRRTFCALLEGAKRIGDLGRARWILAEMVRLVKSGGLMKGDVDEEVMMHVFHAYASYVPPYTRSMVKEAKEDTPKELKATENSAAVTRTAEAAVRQSGTKDAREFKSGPDLPPQTRGEVVAEAKLLFDLISPQDNSEHRFQHIKLTPRLINSYLSVHYRHSSMESACSIFWDIFERIGVSPNSISYIEALERCRLEGRGEGRRVALKFAEELWETFTAGVEADLRRSKLPKDARLIERAHAAYIKVLTLCGRLTRAVNQCRRFMELYPPSEVRDATLLVKPPMFGTRTSLSAPRPLIRAFAKHDVPDDHVPPFLTFGDVELLHHRLVDAGPLRKDRERDIAFLKWMCKRYEWELRMRRDRTMKAKPAKDTKGVTAKEFNAAAY